MKLLRTILVVTILCFSMALTSAWAGPQQDMQSALSAFRAGKIPQAITLYEKALYSGKLSARDKAMVSYNLGNLYLKRQGSFKERTAYQKKAFSYYGMAVRYDPGYAKAYNNRGNLYRQNASLNKALADYTRAIKADPKFAPAWRNRAIVYEKKYRYPEAVKDLTQYLRLKPGDQSARAKLAGVNQKIRQKEKNQVLAMQDVKSGMAAMQAKRYEQAIGLFGKAISYKALSDYSSSRTLANRGTCWYKLGHYAKAAQSYSSAISIDPKFAGAYRDRGTAYIKMSRYSMAVTDLTRAVKLAPRLIDAYYNRALAYWSMKNWLQAEKDMAYYCRLAPRDKRAKAILGKIRSRRPADYQ